MKAGQKQIRVFLSAVTQEELNAIYPAFLNESAKVYVASMATGTPTVVEQLYATSPVEVAVIDAEIWEDFSALVNFLNTRLGQAVAIVLIPQGLVSMEPQLRQLARVREVLVKPVNPAELVKRVHSIGISERVAMSATAPAQAVLKQARGARPSQPAVVTGGPVYAFSALKGGTGKTTTALNFAVRLSQRGVNTCLMGFDVPDDIAGYLDLKPIPNAMSFFNRPGREGFEASIQQPRPNLSVVLAPDSEADAEKVAQRAPNEDGSIADLVRFARKHNPPYGVIVLDLPPTATEWSIQPLLEASAVVLVMEPNIADERKLIHHIRLMTQSFSARYQIPREAMYVVLNRVTPQDNITVESIQEAVAEFLDGFCPPVIGVVQFDPKIRNEGNRGIPAVDTVDHLRQSVDGMIDFFFSGQIGKEAPGAKSLFGFRLPVIRIK